MKERDLIAWALAGAVLAIVVWFLRRVGR